MRGWIRKTQRPNDYLLNGARNAAVRSRNHPVVPAEAQIGPIFGSQTLDDETQHARGSESLMGTSSPPGAGEAATPVGASAAWIVAVDPAQVGNRAMDRACYQAR